MTYNHLLILIPSFDSKEQVRVALQTAAAMAGIKQVTIAAFDTHHLAREVDVDVVDICLPATKNCFGRIVNMFRRIIALRKLKHTRNIACTISFGNCANIVNVLSKRQDQIILSVRDSTSISKGRFRLCFWRMLYRRAKVVLCVTKKLKEELSNACKIPEDRVVAIYNPYEIAEIQRKSAQSTPFEILKPTVVSVGKMENEKGFRHLLRAIKIASEKISELNLILIGDGRILPELKQLSKELGIQERVRFTGFQENPIAISAKCSCYVLSSVCEGFPDAMMEAMSCGVPVIAVDCKNGPREILGAGIKTLVDQVELCEYGILCSSFQSDFSREPQKEKALANAIVEMLSNERVKTAYRVRSELRASMFSFEQYRKRLLDVFFLLEEST